jgi:hypothetical protein
MRSGTCVCGRAYYDDDGPCHYRCEMCDDIVNALSATAGMIEMGLCETCLVDHRCGELSNDETD